MNASDQQLVTRKAAVAGQFYPGSVSELNRELGKFFADCPIPDSTIQVRAVVVPHAGYVYSGAVAAKAFSLIPRNSEFDNIFVIGSSHRIAFDGASIYTLGNFSTPLGEVPVNIELASGLVRGPFFSNRTDAHQLEHCLEVELPFLQYWLEKPFRIVPIVIGTENPNTCRKIADALRPYFNASNLFVISTDFSHYPGYKDANLVDHTTARAILGNDPDELIRVLDENDGKGIAGLATSLCGWTSVLTLMNLTEDINLDYKLIDYKNSGDAATYGDKSRVVGYCAIAVSEKTTRNSLKIEKFNLSEIDFSTLLETARKSIDSYLRTGQLLNVQENSLSPALLTHAGAFVSLYKDGKLRGCIGRFNPNEPLYKVVQEMAVSSATKDHRFNRVTLEELLDLRIEISVLTPLKPISSVQELELGKHGIYIVKGDKSGTFLPQVALSTGWTLEEFLGHCARDKAGIGWDGWKDAELFSYEAIVFGEK
jgi:AmmeMemoRadiSam system protein B/AmmeMemoRadiSam system protein A